MMVDFLNSLAEMANLSDDAKIQDKISELQNLADMLGDGEISAEEFVELVQDATDLENINSVANVLDDKIALQKLINQIQAVAGTISRSI